MRSFMNRSRHPLSSVIYVFFDAFWWTKHIHYISLRARHVRIVILSTYELRSIDLYPRSRAGKSSRCFTDRNKGSWCPSIWQLFHNKVIRFMSVVTDLERPLHIPFPLGIGRTCLLFKYIKKSWYYKVTIVLCREPEFAWQQLEYLLPWLLLQCW